MATKQKTYYVGDKKIQIKSRPTTYMGNQCGWNVFVNGHKFFSNLLTREEAEKSCYLKYECKVGG